MNAEVPPPWPHLPQGPDERLDVQSVLDQTGCTPEDFSELSGVFLEECNNMTQRLQRAEAALAASANDESLAQAADLLRTAAHELATSFGIVGARRAEAYARQTQTHIKLGSQAGAARPGQADLLSAARILMQAVLHSADLLRQRQP